MAISKRAQLAVMVMLLLMVTACSKSKEWLEVHQQAMELYKHEKYDAAITLEKEALVIAHNDGPNVTNVASSLFSLGSYNRKKGQNDEAESFYKQAIMVFDKTGSPKVVIFIGDLAQMYIDLGRYAEAEPLLERYLSIVEKENNRGAVAAGLDALAQVYKGTGRMFQYTYTLERAAKVRQE
jgi:tetratricopeptide (TPR) repeat protein